MADLVTRSSTDLEQTQAPSEPEIVEEDEGGVMTLREHLVELRDRVFRAVLAVMIGSSLGWTVADPVAGFYVDQICTDAMRQANGQCTLLGIEPTEALMTKLYLSLYLGIAISLPFVLYQLIRYIAPGLTRAEKRVVFTVMPFVLLLFFGGAAFSLLLVSPTMLRFLANVVPWIKPELRAAGTLNLAINVALWMGIVFQLPLVMLLLSRFGLVPARRFWEFWRYAVLAILVIAAVITPTPDPFNLFMVAAPMLVLYFAGIGLARLVEGRRRPLLTAAS